MDESSKMDLCQAHPLTSRVNTFSQARHPVRPTINKYAIKLTGGACNGLPGLKTKEEARKGGTISLTVILPFNPFQPGGRTGHSSLRLVCGMPLLWPYRCDEAAELLFKMWAFIIQQYLLFILQGDLILPSLKSGRFPSTGQLKTTAIRPRQFIYSSLERNDILLL